MLAEAVSGRSASERRQVRHDLQQILERTARSQEGLSEELCLHRWGSSSNIGGIDLRDFALHGQIHLQSDFVIEY